MSAHSSKHSWRVDHTACPVRLCAFPAACVLKPRCVCPFPSASSNPVVSAPFPHHQTQLCVRPLTVDDAMGAGTDMLACCAASCHQPVQCSCVHGVCVQQVAHLQTAPADPCLQQQLPPLACPVGRHAQPTCHRQEAHRDRQTDRQTGTQIAKQARRQAGRQADR